MGTQSREPSDTDTVTITKSDGYFVARDEETGVADQGETKAEALANLAEALELHTRPVPDDADEPETASAPWFDSSSE
jgi:predicted RNase H-like HicB family nuclease